MQHDACHKLLVSEYLRDQQYDQVSWELVNDLKCVLHPYRKHFFTVP